MSETEIGRILRAIGNLEGTLKGHMNEQRQQYTKLIELETRLRSVEVKAAGWAALISVATVIGSWLLKSYLGL